MDLNQKRWDILKRNSEFAFPCRTDEILQEGQPFSTAVYKVEETTSNENLNNILQKKRRSPRSRSRCRSSSRFLAYHGRLHISDHGAPGTKPNGPKNDFPISLNYIDTQRHTKTILDVLQETFTDDLWNIWRQVTVWTQDRCDKIQIAQQKSTRRT